jgi:uncharacterized membrane protein YfcA
MELVLLIVGATLIGATLGLMGSGGSILTVPVLVYLLGHEKRIAVAESLAIVGLIALVGMIPYARNRQIVWRSVLFFGVSGMLGAYLGAWVGANYLSDSVKLLLLAVIMLVSAAMMYRGSNVPKETTNDHEAHHNRSTGHRSFWWLIAAQGIFVGMITGLVGVGGGFLIVPALVLLGGLSMRMTIGTSLMIISLNSLVGFAKYYQEFQQSGHEINWTTIGSFALIGALGAVMGHRFGQGLTQSTLRRGFSVLLFVLGVTVFAVEFWSW